MAQSANGNDILFEVKGLKKYFPIHRGLLRRTVGHVKAVDDVSFFIRRGETLGLVGESGSGKTTASRTAIRLYEATEGEVHFRSRVLGNGSEQRINLLTLPKDQIKAVRREIAMIFQDPVNSLNPRMSMASTKARKPTMRLLNCSTRSVCGQNTWGATRTSFPVGNANVSALPAP